MWCPDCDLECGETDVCPQCGGSLVKKSAVVFGGNSEKEILKKWPKDETGAPVAPAFLTHTSSLDMADGMLISMLDAFGVPAIRQYTANGGFGKLILGVSGEGVDILVPETQLKEAKDIIGGSVDE